MHINSLALKRDFWALRSGESFDANNDYARLLKHIFLHSLNCNVPVVLLNTIGGYVSLKNYPVYHTIEFSDDMASMSSHKSRSLGMTLLTNKFFLTLKQVLCEPKPN